jgi:hypothetical protein
MSDDIEICPGSTLLLPGETRLTATSERSREPLGLGAFGDRSAGLRIIVNPSTGTQGHVSRES